MDIPQIPLYEDDDENNVVLPPSVRYTEIEKKDSIEIHADLDLVIQEDHATFDAYYDLEIINDILEHARMKSVECLKLLAEAIAPKSGEQKIEFGNLLLRKMREKPRGNESYTFYENILVSLISHFVF